MMPIEILAIGTLLIILALAIAVRRDWQKDKQVDRELAEFEASVAKLEKELMPMNRAMFNARCNLYYINTDELLGMQSAAYAEYETPSFIADALERRADIEEIPDEKLSAFVKWANEESEE